MMNINKIFTNIRNIFNKKATQNKTLNNKMLEKFKLLEKFFNHKFIKETGLYDRYYNKFINIKSELEEFLSKKESATVKIAVVGSFSCGKSSFINSIIGEDITPVAINRTTCFITTFSYGEKVIIKNSKGIEIGKKEYKEMVINDKLEGNEFYISYPCEKLKSIEILDTPGSNSVQKDNNSAKKDTDLSKEASKRADIIFYLPDIADGTLDASSLKDIKEIKQQEDTKKDIYIIFTQSDKKSPNERVRVYESVKKLLEKNKIDVCNYLIYSSLPIEKQTQTNKDFFSDKKKELLGMLDKIVNSKNEILSYKNKLIMKDIEDKFRNFITEINDELDKILNDDFVKENIDEKIFYKRKEEEDKISNHISESISYYEDNLSVYKEYMLILKDPGFMRHYRIVPNTKQISNIIKNSDCVEKTKEILISIYKDTVKDFFGTSPLEINTETFSESTAEEMLIEGRNMFYRKCKIKIKDNFYEIEQELKIELEQSLNKYEKSLIDIYKKDIKEVNDIFNKINV